MSLDYQTYLASREWALKREAVRERCNNTCERCHKAPHQQTHHLTYARVGHELLADLLGVCRACHEFLSGKSEWDPLERVTTDNELPCGCCGEGTHRFRGTQFWGGLPPCSHCGANGCVRGKGPFVEGDRPDYVTAQAGA